MPAHCCAVIIRGCVFVRLGPVLLQALLEVVDSGAKNMEIAIVRMGKANEVRPLFF